MSESSQNAPSELEGGDDVGNDGVNNIDLLFPCKVILIFPLGFQCFWREKKEEMSEEKMIFWSIFFYYYLYLPILHRQNAQLDS